MTEWILLIWIQMRWDAVSPIEQVGPFPSHIGCVRARDSFLTDEINTHYGKRYAICVPVTRERGEK